MGVGRVVNQDTATSSDHLERARAKATTGKAKAAKVPVGGKARVKVKAKATVRKTKARVSMPSMMDGRKILPGQAKAGMKIRGRKKLGKVTSGVEHNRAVSATRNRPQFSRRKNQALDRCALILVRCPWVA